MRACRNIDLIFFASVYLSPCVSSGFVGLFEKKQQLKHLLPLEAAITTYKYLGLFIHEYLTCIENCILTCKALSTAWAILGNSWACFPHVNLIWREDRRKQDGEQMVELSLELTGTK